MFGTETAAAKVSDVCMQMQAIRLAERLCCREAHFAADQRVQKLECVRKCPGTISTTCRGGTASKSGITNPFLSRSLTLTCKDAEEALEWTKSSVYT